MRFQLEQSARFLEKGLEQQEKGNLKAARENLLKAAELLFKTAQESPAPLRESRTRRAEELVARAGELEKLLAGRARAGPAARSRDGEEAAKEWAVVERPQTRLKDVAGLEEAKEQIRIKMIYPFSHPEVAQRYGIKRGGGVLLYGPPGTGKTLMARAIAGEVEAAFFTVKPSEIMSKWVGEAEQNIASLFSTARGSPRSVIFIDELESLVPKRSGSHSTVMQRVVPQILQEMEGFSSSQAGGALLFLGATNEPWSLDEAVMRPGRFDERIYIHLPDLEARCQIFEMNLKDRPIAPELTKEQLVQELAGMTDGYSGADIRRICEKASDIPFLELVRGGKERGIGMQDFRSVMEKLKPSVTPRMLERFDKLVWS